MITNTENETSDVMMNTVIEEDIPTKIIKLKEAFTQYLREHTIYETIPENMKILVFNSELTIKDSIEAMIKEDIYCGLLWETNSSKYVGLFTIRDVLSLITLAYTQLKNYIIKHGPIENLTNIPEDIIKKELLNTINNINNNDMDIDVETIKKSFETSIKNFSQFFKLFDSVTIKDYISTLSEKTKKLISLSLDGNLQECIKIIKENRIHRVVVEDSKTTTVTGFITYEAIFEFFIENYYSEMTEFNIPISSLNIISTDIICLKKTETIYKCMEIFHSKKISLLPIIEGESDNVELFGFVYLKDIIYFFSNGDKFNFNDPIEKFLIDLYDDVDTEKPYGKERIVQVAPDANLKDVFEMMSICPERKLVVQTKNIGVITLSNIFTYLID